MSIFSVGGSTPAADSAVESKSLRFQADEHYLSRAFNQDGNRQTFTISCWVKVTDTASRQLFGSSTNASIGNPWPGFIVSIDPTSSSGLSLEEYNGSSYNAIKQTANLLRDPAAWYHIVIRYDTTQGIAANRIRIYINGTEATYNGTNTNPSQNYESYWNDNKTHRIGKGGSSNGDFGGYMAEFYSIDGQSLDPSYFAETDSDTNQWKPKTVEDIKAAVTFGVNGFYLPFSNDVLDTSFLDTGSGSRHTVTAVGNVHTDTTIKKLGTASAQFDGTGDALTCPDHADFTLVDAMFTLEAYVYLSNTNRQVFISKYDESGNNREFKWEYESNNMMFGYSTNGSSNTWLSFAWTPSVDTWYHIAICRDGSSTIRAFVDGTQIGSNQVVSSSFYNGSALLSIGVNIHNGSPLNSGLTGYMDEIRICNIGKYTYNFTPPTVAFESDTRTKLLLHCDGSDGGTSFTDSATHTITANGDAKNIRVSNHSMVPQSNLHIIGPKIGTGCYANVDNAGTEWLQVADSADWTFGTGDFTLEGWINTPSTTEQTLYSQYADASNRWYLTVDNRDNVQTIAMYHHASGLEIETSTGSAGLIGVNKWVHIAAVRASGVISIYVDGVALALATNTSANANMTDVAAVLQVGAYNDGQRMKGYMDELRVSNSARYTSNFTPDTTAFSNDANTKLLLHCDGAIGSTTFTDSSSSAHTVTPQGSAMIVAPKIGTGFGVYDGASYMETATAPGEFAFGTSDFTFDFWAYHKGAWTDEYFLEAYGGSNDYWILKVKAGGDLQIESKISSVVVDVNFNSANMPTDAWVHIEISRTGSTWRCFINGTETGDGQTSSGSMGETPRQLKIGYSGQYNDKFTGYMDEFRISTTVRHTSNFTPTTTAYTDDIDTILLLHMDGGGGIDATTNLPTLVGQGTYFFDDSVNAIFYGADGVPTNKSIISFDGTGDYLTAPSSDAWDFGTGEFTLEMWIRFVNKKTGAGAAGANALLANHNSPNGWQWIWRGSDNTFELWATDGSEYASSFTLNNDTWYHVAVTRDDNTLRHYVDGVQCGSNAFTETMSDTSTTLQIGAYDASGLGLIDGYMEEIRISNTCRYPDGTTFTPSTTAFTADANTKLLIHSDFTDGGLGADHSGNYNYFTPNNLGAHDMVEDSPTNNFCTLNPLDYQGSITASEGNLKAITSSSDPTMKATFDLPSSGKWYWEFCMLHSTSMMIGVVDQTSTGAAYSSNKAVLYSSGLGTHYNFSSVSANDWGARWTAGDIIAVAFNRDDNQIIFYKNNVAQPTLTIGGTADQRSRLIPLIVTGTSGTGGGTFNFGQDSSFAGYKNDNTNPQPDANGKSDFYYAPPAGYLALCTDNLDDPAIALPTDHFNTTLWTGNGSSGTSRAITGAGHAPDLVWLKNRDYGSSHNIQDSVRGGNKNLHTNTTDAETTNIDGGWIDSFDSDGFTLQIGGGGANEWYDNRNGNNIVGWSWKAGGTASSNGDGSKTSSVSANPTAGFSIVTYTGDGTGPDTVGHGLSSAPELILVKNRSSVYDWKIYNETIGNTKYLSLNTSDAEATASTNWNDTSPTASVFTVNTNAAVNQDTSLFVAYCFHSVEGYSKVGSYTGENALADAPFVYTGFRPAFIFIKRTNAAGSNSYIADSKRIGYNNFIYATDVGSNKYLWPDASTAESGGNSTKGIGMDILSNGFKFRTVSSDYNSGGNTYIYYAIAETPFKTANAR